MNIYNIIAEAQCELDTADGWFLEQTDTLVALLRAEEVLPTTRIVNGNHATYALFAALLIVAHKHGWTVDLPARDNNAFRSRGITTRFLTWLDECVARHLLVSQHGYKQAKGRMHLGKLIQLYAAPATSGEESAT